MTLLSTWHRLPVIIRAILIGSLMAIAGTVPWAAMVSVNIKYQPAFPWAVLLTILYLLFYWRFAKGKGWPRRNAETRKRLCRANPVPADVWGAAILAGILGLVALLLFQNVLNRMIRLPQQQTTGLTDLPAISVFFFVIMGSIVAGVTEEISFRGYMQGPIERRHGPFVAMLITGLLFGFAHFTHAETTLSLLPFYMGVAVIYGSMAYITNSILPGIVLHAAGDIMGAFQLLAGGRSEWQATTTPSSLIWEKGADTSFWMTVILTLLLTFVAIWSFRSLSSLVKRESSSPTNH